MQDLDACRISKVYAEARVVARKPLLEGSITNKVANKIPRIRPTLSSFSILR
jgi:hypothetical protein